MQPNCRICGQSIARPFPGKIYCSRRCRIRAWRLAAREKGKVLRAGVIVKLAEAQCLQCGNLFDPARSSQKYCSSRCRQRASNFRNSMQAAASRTTKPLEWLGSRPCKHCQKDFIPRTHRQLYCSFYCRALANGETTANALKALELEKNA